MQRICGWTLASFSAGGLLNAYNYAKEKDIPLNSVPVSIALEPVEKLFFYFMSGKENPAGLTIKQAQEIVENFNPLPFPCAEDLFGLQRNGHWQTIVGTGSLRKIVTGKELSRSFDVISERIKTDDGDFFDVDYPSEHFGPSADTKRTPIVIIVHGLEATYRGAMVTKMAEEYMAQGFAPVLFSFRGCSGTPNKTPGGYHVGFTNDVDLLAKILQKRFPQRKIYLSGFSLGGNVSLKLLAELGSTASTERNIFGAVTMSVPYDAVGSGASIDAGWNKYLYAKNFLGTLKRKAEEQHKLFPNAFDIEQVRSSQTIGEFDRAFIAPIYGYKDQFDYYQKNGSKAWLPKIRVPAISINAKDDPFIPEHTLPDPHKDVMGAPVRLVYHDHGGHCGFVASRRSRESGKGSELIATHSTDAPVNDANGNDDRWIAKEMARAMKHIHVETEKMTSR